MTNHQPLHDAFVDFAAARADRYEHPETTDLRAEIQTRIANLPTLELKALEHSPTRIITITDDIFRQYNRTRPPIAFLLTLRELQEIRHLAQVLKHLLS